MQDSLLMLWLTKETIVIDKVTFQHEADIPCVAPIVPVTLAVAASTSLLVVSDDEDEKKSLISSLSKLFEKGKLVRTSKKTLGEFLDRM